MIWTDLNRGDILLWPEYNDVKCNVYLVLEPTREIIEPYYTFVIVLVNLETAEVIQHRINNWPIPRNVEVIQIPLVDDAITLAC